MQLDNNTDSNDVSGQKDKTSQRRFAVTQKSWFAKSVTPAQTSKREKDALGRESESQISPGPEFAFAPTLVDPYEAQAQVRSFLRRSYPFSLGRRIRLPFVVPTLDEFRWLQTTTREWIEKDSFTGRLGPAPLAQLAVLDPGFVISFEPPLAALCLPGMLRVVWLLTLQDLFGCS